MEITPVEYLFKLNRLDAVKFMSIRNYTNANGETSNYTLIAAFQYQKAVEKDIVRLQRVKYEGVKELARLEMLNALIKNQSDETRSVQSQAQLDAYVALGQNSRIHLSTKTIMVYAFLRAKKVLVPGTYKQVNKALKTKFKEQIAKELRLSTRNFRQFKLAQISASALNGERLDITI